ncbi:glycosyltransferase family 2 protein [Rhodovulum sp. 12E13]|nr:glycosyltransferase family 2 protein [Rhodovulum sp. 12E13]
MRNEAPYLVEWLAHHRALGVTDITVFSNDCTDGTNLMLDRLQAMGVLRHHDNPVGKGMDPQRRAYWRANRMDAVRGADWLLVIDADEFLNLHAGDRTLPALLEETGHPDAISLGWRLMGSGGAARWVDAPVTGRFTRGCSLEAPENGLVRGVKSLFRPAAFDYFGVHRPRFEKTRKTLPPVRWLNGSGQEMSEAILRKGWRFPGGEEGYALGQVNHYAVKSREEFLLKRLRGTANSKDRDRIDMGYWERFDLNGETDTTIETERAAEEAERLLADADLAALRRAAVATARRVLAAQLEDARLRAFVEQGESAPRAAE